MKNLFKFSSYHQIYAENGYRQFDVNTYLISSYDIMLNQYDRVAPSVLKILHQNLRWPSSVAFLCKRIKKIATLRCVSR